MCFVAWPLNENEAGDDLVMIETSLLFLCEFLLINLTFVLSNLQNHQVLFERGVSSEELEICGRVLYQRQSRLTLKT